LVNTLVLLGQSPCDEVFTQTRRVHCKRDAERAVSLLREAGMNIILQMMTGLPGASRERDLETARRIIALKPDGVRIYPTVIIKDTPLYDAYIRGEYKEHTVEEAACLCAELLPMFDAGGIPVIRLGLNPTDDLSGGDAVGGAYHPAFGELVRARLFRERAMEKLSGRDVSGRDVIISVAPPDVSKMTGQKKENIKFICEKTGAASVKVKAEPGLPAGETDIKII
ncbi:MAG: radical SAM protein, partial [Oscillospiraceae bacterium]|nr:radical SAM protein [Oscillospiraceae bacterium]